MGTNWGRQEAKVIIESPFGGEIEEQDRYHKECFKHSLSMREFPLSKIFLYHEFGLLDEKEVSDIDYATQAIQVWGQAADYIVFYLDLGQDLNMIKAQTFYEQSQIPMKFRYIT